MDLFTYLMAKKGHNTHRDLFSYLLGKNAGGSGTYTTFSGTSLNISNTLQAKIKNIALEGNTSQDGTPTPDTPIPIKVVTGEQNIKIHNKNLFDKNDNFAYGYIDNSGSFVENSRIVLFDSYIKVNGGNTYTFSANTNLFNITIVAYDSSKIFISRKLESNNKINTWSIPANCKYLRLQFNYNNELGSITRELIDFLDLQLEEGSTVTEFVSYQSQTYPLSLGNIELAKIGNYKDYIFKNVTGSPYYNANLDLNGWYLHKDINKFTLNGVTDKWDRQTASGGYRFRCFTYQSVINSMNNSIGYSNYFKNNGDTNTHNGIFGNGGVIQLRDDNLFTIVSDVTNWLSEHNTIVYYIKKTTTNTKITDTTLIQQLENINNNARSYKDTTIIECTSESTNNEIIGFSGDIKVTSVGLGNSLNTSLLSSNIQNEEETNIDDIQEEPNLDDVNEIEEQNDELIENEEIEEPIEEEYQEL